MKIKVKFIDSDITDYVWVRPVPKPLSGGHKALKNEDFIDHDDMILRHSYYKQVVERRLNERYLKRVSAPQTHSKEEQAFNKQMGAGRHNIVPVINDAPIHRIPKAE